MWKYTREGEHKALMSQMLGREKLLIGDQKQARLTSLNSPLLAHKQMFQLPAYGLESNRRWLKSLVPFPTWKIGRNSWLQNHSARVVGASLGMNLDERLLLLITKSEL